MHSDLWNFPQSHLIKICLCYQKNPIQIPDVSLIEQIIVFTVNLVLITSVLETEAKSWIRHGNCSEGIHRVGGV